LFAATSLVGSEAAAQSDENRSGARAAATAGGNAFQEHKWAEAIDMFTRAESLVHSPVHLLYTARAHEKLGQLVRAREAYIKITNEDLPKNAPEPYRAAKKDAERELAALDPRVPSVTITLKGPAPSQPGAAVTMDGQPVPAALVGVPRPVDPGEHRFEASAEGYAAQPVVVRVAEGRSEAALLELVPTGAPIPLATPVAGAAVAPVAQPPGEAPPPAAPPGADKGSHGPHPLTWVAFGVGALGLGLGTFFAVTSKSKVDEANGLCKNPGPDGASDWCTPESGAKASELDDDAKFNKTLAIVSFVAAGVGIGAGVSLLVATGKSEQKAAAPSITPFIGLGAAGVRGRF
jgi:hypothetical protein